MKKILYLIICLTVLLPLLTYSAAEQWYKGNTHCHTLNSDGDEFPRRVIRWYRDHGYHFLAITEHNKVTEVKHLDTDPLDDFILIQGEEVTDSFRGSPLHVNALGIKELVRPMGGDSKVEVLQNNIDAIVAAGAMPQLNHPNWKWAFTDQEISQLKRVRLFELYNICLDCNNFPAGGKPGMEEIWDKILSRGVLLYGVASDDAHDYIGEFTPEKSNPGTGWIMVRATELTSEAILNALEKGDFYATVGVTLTDVEITDTAYSIKIQPYLNTAYTTFFIGKDGEILQESYGLEAVYTFTGEELYVRARVFESSGRFACTQPVFIEPPE